MAGSFMAWVVLELVVELVMVMEDLVAGPVLLAGWLFLFLLQSLLPTTEPLVVGAVAVAVAGEVKVHLEAVAAVVSVRSPPTLRLVRLARTSGVLAVAMEMPELILRREAVVAVDIFLRIAHALESLSTQAAQAALVDQEAHQDQPPAEEMPPTYPTVLVAPGAAQSQEIQTSLGWLQEQDSGASHEHHLFF